MNPDDPQQPAADAQSEPDGFVDEQGRLGWEQYRPKPADRARPLQVRRVAPQRHAPEAASTPGPRLAAVGVMLIVAAVVTAGVALAMGSAVLGWVGAAIALSAVGLIVAGYQRYRRS
mgnify:CR=1 FL=1